MSVYVELTREFNRGRLRALDAERRELIHAHERLDGYMSAAKEWAAIWPSVARDIDGLPLPDAHRVVT